MSPPARSPRRRRPLWACEAPAAPDPSPHLGEVPVPGQRYHYSDAGFITLGRIAERVTGRSLGRLFHGRVFEPLGLTHSSYRNAVSMPRGAVHGYFRPTLDAPFADTQGWNHSYLGGAGAAVSTLDDPRRLAPAIATGKGLLSHRMQRKAARPDGRGSGHCGNRPVWPRPVPRTVRARRHVPRARRRDRGVTARGWATRPGRGRPGRGRPGRGRPPPGLPRNPKTDSRSR
jgi:CubicO group peptidase (beta-lactamase class C family)